MQSLPNGSGNYTEPLMAGVRERQEPLHLGRPWGQRVIVTIVILRHGDKVKV